MSRIELKRSAPRAARKKQSGAFLPIPKNATVTKVMVANKSRNTGPEKLFRAALRKIGMGDYKLHAKSLPGSPDVIFKKEKVAVFVHGCYWHSCVKCRKKPPKHNRLYWAKKFERNLWRDAVKSRMLRKLGWQPIVIWEHEIKNDAIKAAKKVQKKIAFKNLSFFLI